MVLMELMENLMVLSEGVPFLKTKKCLGEFHGKKRKGKETCSKNFYKLQSWIANSLPHEQRFRLSQNKAKELHA